MGGISFRFDSSRSTMNNFHNTSFVSDVHSLEFEDFWEVFLSLVCGGRLCSDSLHCNCGLVRTRDV